MYSLDKWIAGIARPIFRANAQGGSLEIVKKDATLLTAGDGLGPSFVMSIKSWRTLLKIIRDPEFNLGETYINQEWELQEGDLGQFITWLVRNNRTLMEKSPGPKQQLNNPHVSRKNVSVHYDLGNDLYQSFLDEGMNYSCAFFEDHRVSLRDAQLNKIHTTIARADVKPGMTVLDIGCGWGELCRTLAGYAPGIHVTGITLSEQQYAWVTEKNRINSPHADFLLRDYRQHAAHNPESCDRIISVGMFEHVGRYHYDEFFNSIHRLLKPGGKAIVHSIMTPKPGPSTSRWLDTYIFPGGCIPYMPDALASIRSQGLVAGEPYIHESHNYAETLRRWRQNYNNNKHALDPAKYDERFHRIWNFYLAVSEAAFDGLGYYVAQIPLEKPR